MPQKRKQENQPENEFQPMTKFSKNSSSSSLRSNSDGCTSVILIDFCQEECSEQLSWLHKKISLPANYWMDMNRDYDYIPIEYSKNFNFLAKFFTTHNYFTYNYALSPDIQGAVSILFRDSPAMEHSKRVTDEIDYDLLVWNRPKNLKIHNNKSMTRVVALQLVCRNATHYFSLPKRFTSNPEIIHELLRQLPKAVRYLPSEVFIEENRNLIMKVMEDYMPYLVGCKAFFENLLTEFSDDLEIMYVAGVISPSVLLSMCSQLRFNEKLMNRIIMMNPEAFRYAPIYIRSDIKTINHVISKDVSLFKFVHSAVKNSSASILEIVSTNGLILKYLQSNTNIIKDYEIVKQAVKTQPSVLQYAHEDLQTNLEFVKEIVSLNIGILKYVHPSLINDEFFVNLARENGFSFLFSQQNFEERNKQLFGSKVIHYLDDTELMNKLARTKGALPTRWYSESSTNKVNKL